MASLLTDTGYIHKETIVKDHLVEATNHYGSSVVVWSGENIDPCDPCDKKDAEHVINSLESDVKGLTGIYLNHPGGWYFKHGNTEYRGSSNVSDFTKILPVVTIPELKQNLVSTTGNADKASSRLTGSILKTVLGSVEKYNEDYVKLTDASRKYLELHDNASSDMIKNTRSIRDKIRESHQISDNQITSLQDKEVVLQYLHTHASDIIEYSKLLQTITERFNDMTRELQNLHRV